MDKVSKDYIAEEIDPEDIITIFEITSEELMNMLSAFYPDRLDEHGWKLLGEESDELPESN